MSHELELIFRELGIAQYLDTFVEQGFDSWDTILDIQESDLDALGVKLGHRRKLQRRIANARGIAASVSLASPIKANTEDGKQDMTRKGPAIGGNHSEGTVVTKRKYRRHPKPDDNAPERPPSAYVLFSNKLREGLKGQTLTFTEIAKLVGENWQSLLPPERELYESQANAAKERYHRDMAHYKKTPEYRKYMRYLQEFKERQGKSSQGQEMIKRAKLEQNELTNNSTTSGSTAGSIAALGGSTSTTSGSSSERMRESESREPPPSRRQDSVNSVASAPDSRHSSAAPKSITSLPSPQSTHFDSSSSSQVHQRHSRRTSSLRGKSRRGGTPQQHLPSLSDVLVESPRSLNESTSTDGLGHGSSLVSGFTPANYQPSVSQGPPALPLGFMPHHHESSSGRNRPQDSVTSLGQRVSDAPLAIHALLSDEGPPHPGTEISSSSATMMASPTEQGKPAFGNFQGPRGYGFQTPSSAFQHMKVEESRDGDILMTRADEPSAPNDGSRNDVFDGMNALLEAGEIVGRQSRGG